MRAFAVFAVAGILGPVPAPSPGEVPILAMTRDLTLLVAGKESFRMDVVRDADALLAAAGVPADKRDPATRRRVLADSAKAFGVKAIDFDKNMIVAIAFDFSPTPRSFPEVVRVTSGEKTLIVHWRWASPDIDTDQVGHGALIALLLPRSEGEAALRSVAGRTVPGR